MQVTEICPGLWRWTALHEEWGEEVGSVSCETEDGVVLVDPLVPSSEEERFWRALDRDVARAGGAAHVFLTVFWHARSAAAVRDRYRARLWAPARGRAAVERRAGRVTDVVRPGQRLPGGVEARPTARGTEVVYWLPRFGALVPGDALLGDGEGGLRLPPASWLPSSTTRARLAEALRPLLELPVERVLVSHGEPVLSGARRALAAALEDV